MTTASVKPRENLTRSEAEARADRITVEHTRVHLDLTGDHEHFASVSEVSFTVRTAGEVFLDCTAARVHEVVLNGTRLDPTDAVRETRILLGDLTPGDHHVRVQAMMRYQHEGAGLHHFVDPSDDRVYLHTQFEPFDAHLVYACFDQPDLKTVFEVAVDAPAEWVVVSNSRAISRPDEGEAGTWRFAPTPPVSTYITAVVAGSYTSVHDVYARDDGSAIDLGLYVRRSLAEYLDADELFDVTKQSFAAFERLFDQPYPFGDAYDQLFVPEFSAGAMENPGCVTFTETYVFRSKVTDAIRERRAETIIHEMAHMWFGDLVTMRWWDDLWLNESFATFMAVFVQATSTRWRDAWVTFQNAEKAWATYQDQLPSTHPVADAMADVESVHQNFDGITYAKGASVLRQLVAWVGEEAFLAGCRDYFARHAWGNTTLEDFLAALERASGRDLAAWRDEWLLTTGVNRLAVEAPAGDGTYPSVTVTQSSPAPSWAGLAGTPAAPEVLRRHRLGVGLYDRSDEGITRRRREELDVTGARTEVGALAGAPTADIVLVNDGDLTYAKARLDDATLAVVTAHLSEVVEPLPRAQLWGACWEMVRDAELDARTFVEVVRRHAADETQVGVLQRLHQRAVAAAERYGDPAATSVRLAELATSARRALEDATPGGDHQLAWLRHWASVARADPEQLTDVHRLLSGELSFDGVELDVDLRWHLVTCLSRAGAVDEHVIDTELERDPTDFGHRHAATARASRPTAAAKAQAWERLLGDTGLSHTMSRQIWNGFSQLDQGPVLAPYAEAYFAVLDDVWRERSLDWAIEFSTALFPHASADDGLLAEVDRRLADDELPRPLRRVLLEQRDVLVRTLQARVVDVAAGS